MNRFDMMNPLGSIGDYSGNLSIDQQTSTPQTGNQDLNHQYLNNQNLNHQSFINHQDNHDHLEAFIENFNPHVEVSHMHGGNTGQLFETTAYQNHCQQPETSSQTYVPEYYGNPTVQFVNQELPIGENEKKCCPRWFVVLFKQLADN